MLFLVISSHRPFSLLTNWQLLAGILPPYWSLKVFWLAAAGMGYWPFLLAGLLVNLAMLTLLLQRFERVVHR